MTGLRPARSFSRVTASLAAFIASGALVPIPIGASAAGPGAAPTVEISADSTEGTCPGSLLHASFANFDYLEIASEGPATVYPSTIQVHGLNGTVSEVTTELLYLSHGWPGDLDIALSAPNGQGSVWLMSDCGERLYGAIFSYLVLDQSAALPLPQNGAISGGTYRPTNYGGGDTLPFPGPQSGIGPSLDIYDNLPADMLNGDWNLWIQDDYPGLGGNLYLGWRINITYCPDPSFPTPTPSATATPSATPTPSAEPTLTPTSTPIGFPTATASPSPTSSGTSPSPSPSPADTPTPTPPASPSPSPIPCCPGDADNSGGAVNANDFLAVQAAFGLNNGTGGLGDADCSGGAVNANDFLAVQAAFGSNCD